MPFENDRTNNIQGHNIQVVKNNSTNKWELKCDNNTYTFKATEPCVVCYVIKSQDATINNSSGYGNKIHFRQNSNPSSPPLDGFS